jgi:hypothetical protein
MRRTLFLKGLMPCLLEENEVTVDLTAVRSLRAVKKNFTILGKQK